eukprot:Skav221892  [mRNA]  locus=scaffold1395:645809:648640:+ [translate_table: standard]
MAAFAPCNYGCHGCTNCQSGWTAFACAQGLGGYPRYQQPDVPAMRLRRLMLQLTSFGEKQMEVAQLVQQIAAHEVGPWVRAILEQPVPLHWMHVLSVQMLDGLLQLHPMGVISSFSTRDVQRLFPEQGDVSAAANFLRNLLWTKEAMGRSTKSDIASFVKLLMKRTNQFDLYKVPSCAARSWLTQIWKDVPSTRPNRDLLVGCCVRWVADRYETKHSKATCLEILQEALGQRSRDAEAKIVSLIFQEVCRQPMTHSPDLQQLLYLLPGPPQASTVRALLMSLLDDPSCLMSLWSSISHWAPLGPLMPSLAGIYHQGPVPLFGLLRAMLVAFSQLPNSNMLCRSALMSLAALGTSDSTVSMQAPALLLLLYCEGPVLPTDVWLPLLPLLDHLSQYSTEASELGSRLRALASGSYATAPHGGAQMPRMGSIGTQNQQAHPQLHTYHTMPTAPQGHYSQGCVNQQCQQAQAWQYNQGKPATMQPPAVQTQAGQSPMQALPTQTQFVPLDPDKSKAVPHKPPHVGLQNTNNTCYMNSFIQALFLTDAFVWRINSFNLKLKENPSKMDKEDFEFGKKVVHLFRKQFARMALTQNRHVDIWDILQGFPAQYRSGEQEDVTETIRFVFDKLGGSEQLLLNEVFSGQLRENTQCSECGNVKVREETFTDLVLPVPTAKEVEKSGIVPTIQVLLQNRLKFERMDSDNLVECPVCQKKTQAGKWSEISRPPAHLILCLNRFTFDMDEKDFTKEKTPVKIDESVFIGGYEYEVYQSIIHTGKDASSGHYYAIGRRSESVPNGDCSFYTMDDSRILPADASVMAGNPPENMKDHNAYVLFLRCKQASATPEFRVPNSILDYVKKEDKKR